MLASRASYNASQPLRRLKRSAPLRLVLPHVLPQPLHALDRHGVVDRGAHAADGVPAFNYDRAQTVASLERMKKIAANLKATVIIQHDLRDIGKLPAFPAAAK